MTDTAQRIAPDDMVNILTNAQRSASETRRRRGATSATAWLHYLEEAVTALETAEGEARARCPKNALWEAGKTHANATQALAGAYPEVRRLRVVEIALEAVKWALWDLTEEGKMPVKRLPPLNFEEMPR